MKHIITTILLLIAATVVTVLYFNSINQPGKSPAEVMQHIPNDAALVMEFNNDAGFYEAFSGSALFNSVIGPQKKTELDTLKNVLLNNAAFKGNFNNQHIFLSIHPANNNQLDLLITTSPGSKFDGDLFKKLKEAQNKKFTIANYKKGLKVMLNGISRPFYIAQNEGKIIYGSFSAALLDKASIYNYKEHKDSFLQLSNRQNENALAILYINYGQLQPLFQQLFIAKNTDLLRPLRLVQAKAALSLNYKTDALMFNGITGVKANAPVCYLNLFILQKPVVNTIKSILPATTAYSTTYGVADPPKFVKDLAAWNHKSGYKTKAQQLFNSIKTETGVNFQRDFNQSLGNAFSVVTTRFQEKLAIIQLADNQQLLPSLINISTMLSDNIGQLNYAKIPFYLLGDAFSVFDRPYFLMINNYLVFANTPAELRSYYESYTNQKFLSKTSDFNQFDELQPERSNISFFANFKNLAPVLKRDMKPAFFNSFNNERGFKNFYGACYQLTAADNNFYTNFCMKLNSPDKAAIK